jgi:para-aminobenzoate synthetase/4-amino-4-deoxychorismate lyase
MEVIRQLEASARGIYCGAIGYFAPDGSARFNVAIRTITIEGDSGELGIGGGVVHDSTDAAEYAECLLKAEYFTRTRRPLGLIETLRFAPGVGLVRRDLHLARLARSARSFGIPFDVSTTERLIQDVVSTHVCDARVRLELAEDGSSKVKAEAMNAPAGRIWRYSLSPRRVLSSDALAGHKTDWRIRYDDERTRLQAALGCDEVVFLNERGEVVEGSITNVFLERGDKLLTPPLASGCLDGCLRRELLEQGAAVEAVLYEWDLPTARLYLGNSLRGLILGEFVDASGIETPKTRAQQGRR